MVRDGTPRAGRGGHDTSTGRLVLDAVLSFAFEKQSDHDDYGAFSTGVSRRETTHRCVGRTRPNRGVYPIDLKGHL